MKTFFRLFIIFVACFSLFLNGCTQGTTIEGPKGEDGHSPVITIGDNGNWFIDGVDTNQKAQGEIGPKGENAPHYGEVLTVKYHLNGGVIPSNNETTVNVNWGDTIELPIPVKEHYEFYGWFTGETVNDSQFYNFTPVCKSIDLYADYYPMDYSLTLDLDGGMIDTSINMDYFYNDEYCIPSIPTKNGYVFKEWSYNGEVFPANGQYLYENITVKAIYEPLHFNISLNLDGGHYDGETVIDVAFDDYCNLPLEDITKPGYKFIGWYKDDVLWDNSKVYDIEEDVELIAKYVEVYAINIDFKGGEADFEGFLLVEKDLIENDYTFSVPTKENYKFDGYFLDWLQVIDANGVVIISDIFSDSGETNLIARYVGIGDYIGDFIYMGKYPQTRESNTSIVDALNLITDKNELGYIEYDGKEYLFENNKYYTVEPIKWRVMSDGMVICDSILECQMYYKTPLEERKVNDQVIHPKNYMYSNIRAFLNGYDGTSYSVSDYTGIGFIDIAFTLKEQSKILTSTVDNSLGSTLDQENIFVCENTEDKLFLLSAKELTNTEYCYSEPTVENFSRYATASQYAYDKYGEVNYYFQRTPSSATAGNDLKIRLVNSKTGVMGSAVNVDWPRGILICFKININK